MICCCCQTEGQKHEHQSVNQSINQASNQLLFLQCSVTSKDHLLWLVGVKRKYNNVERERNKLKKAYHTLPILTSLPDLKGRLQHRSFLAILCVIAWADGALLLFYAVHQKYQDVESSDCPWNRLVAVEFWNILVVKMILKKKKRGHRMSLTDDVVRLNPGKWLMAAYVGRDTFHTGEQGYYWETLQNKKKNTTKPSPPPPPPLVP